MTTEAEHRDAQDKATTRRHDELHPEDWPCTIDSSPDPDIYIRIKKANETIWRRDRQ